jgi:polysaccharide export outer membrane protein
MLLLVLVACQKTPPPQTSNETGPPPIYTLGPGDHVRVIVYQQEALSGTFEVDSTGRLALPLIRGVSAKGLTLTGLEEIISQRLEAEQFKNPRVSVDLVKTRPVCVLGEVNKPGCFDYVYGMRAASAIALAGGYTYRALQNSVRVTRSEGDSITGVHETLLYPGDIIEIDERFF